MNKQMFQMIDIITKTQWPLIVSNTPIKAKFNVKPSHKCLLPSCQKFTQHNGGYCCAEHSKQHKQQK